MEHVKSLLTGVLILGIIILILFLLATLASYLPFWFFPITGTIIVFLVLCYGLGKVFRDDFL
jgi:hypothetical protein